MSAEHLTNGEGMLKACADWHTRTGGTLPVKITCFEAAAVVEQLAQLRAWKESALALEREWDAQAIGKMLGLPLGVSIRKGIHEKVPQLVADLARLRKLYSMPQPKEGPSAERPQQPAG